jgi:uncharacterized protein (TIGR02147 family)
VSDRYPIYHFPDFSSYVAHYVKSRKEIDPSFTYRRFSKRMGLKSESILRMVASGKRKASPDLVYRISSAVGFNSKELEYAEALAGLHRTRKLTEKSRYAEKLRTLSPGAESHLIEIDELEIASHWIHGAILEMTGLKDFESNAAWISRRLGGTVTVKVVTDAIERLKRAGLLKHAWDGNLVRTTKPWKTPTNIPTRAQLNLHRQLLGKAAEAIEKKEPGHQILDGTTLTVDSKNLNAVRELVEEFQRKIARIARADKGDETYQLAVQFFPITESPNTKPRG